MEARESQSGDGAGQSALLALVRELAEGTATGPIGPGTRLEEIGFDSLAYAELAAAAEERLGLAVPDDEVRRPDTAGELVALLGAAPRAGERASRVDGLDAERPPVPRGLGRFQRPGAAVAGGVLRRWFRLSLRGAERMPAAGPVILCMNHESLLDIPLAVVASPRPITFMAKRELFRNRVGGRVLHELGGFRVDRDAFDLRAIRTAMAVLARGDVLGMYPEGTREPGELLPFLPGAAWLALRTGASLLPAGIRGTEVAMPRGQRLPRRVAVSLEFGPPIEVSPTRDPAKRRVAAGELTGRLREAVQALLA